MSKHNKRLPAWLVGLIVAAVVSLMALFVFSALGFGDDPVVDSVAVFRAWGLWAVS